MRKAASLTSIIVGILMVVAGVVVWVVISNTLASQRITVSADADCAAGDDVNGPISAFCQAVRHRQAHSQHHRRQDLCRARKSDPNRATAMNSAFLQASLFTSVVAFGVCLMAIGVGAVFTLIGFAFCAPRPRPGRRTSRLPPPDGSARPRTGHAEYRPFDTHGARRSTNLRAPFAVRMKIAGEGGGVPRPARVPGDQLAESPRRRTARSPAPGTAPTRSSRSARCRRSAASAPAG